MPHRTSTRTRTYFLASVCALLATAQTSHAGSAWRCPEDKSPSRWLQCGSDNKLRYSKDPSTGASIADYAAVGYAAGARPLPQMATRKTVAPSGKDDTQAIQAALDAVAARTPDALGLRGRVLLAPGAFKVSKTLQIKASGISLEGSGARGSKRTTVTLAGSAKLLLQMIGPDKARDTAGKRYAITEPQPAGRLTLSGVDTSGLRAGDDIAVSISHNSKWLKTIWGGTYPPKRDNKTQTAWGNPFVTRALKTIVAVKDKTVTLNAPLTDSIDADALLAPAGAWITKVDSKGLIRDVGVGHMQVLGRFVGGVVNPTVQLSFVSMNNVEDAWVDNIDATDFGMSFVITGVETRRVTIQDVHMLRTDVQAGGAKPFDISLSGTQILVQGCKSVGDQTFYVATQSGSRGPNVVYNMHMQGAGAIEPHQRWATGLLIDNVIAPQGGVALVDRGAAGSGHGWGSGDGVVYNSVAGTEAGYGKSGMDQLPGHSIGQPPLSLNLGIGLVGPQRISNKQNRVETGSKAMPSLYAQQTWQRFGAAGLQRLMGPWKVTDLSGARCLQARAATHKSPIDVADCGKNNALSLWELTSRGAVRLAGTDLCLDSLAGEIGRPAQLKTCNESVAQQWWFALRDGDATWLAQTPRPVRQPKFCLYPQANGQQLQSCLKNAASWRLRPGSVAQ